MRAHTLLGVTIAIALLFASSSIAAFEFNAVLWDRERSPLILELHNADVGDLTVAEMEMAVQNTIRTWNDVPCAWLKLEYGGLTDDRIEGTDARNDRQILEFVVDEEEWFYGSMTAGAMLADVYDPPETPEREQPRVDIAFNGVDFFWKIDGAGIRMSKILDPESVLTHEVGHLMGLSHTPVSNAATMAPVYLHDLGQRTLSFDDKSGLCAKYWTQGDECDDDTDCLEGSSCATYNHEESGESARLCAEPHGSWGEFCNSDALVCEGYCLFTVTDLSEGTCSDLCNPDNMDDCPEGWLCVNTQTASNPLFFCREDPDFMPNPDPEPDTGNTEPDTGIDAPDTGISTIDTGSANDMESGEPDTNSEDEEETGDGEADDGCGCATLHQPAPHHTLPVGVSLIVLGLFYNRRRTR